MESLRIFAMTFAFMMFVIMMFFLFNYGSEVKNDPCSVCAKRLPADVFCTLTSPGGTATRAFIHNGTITDSLQYNSSMLEDVLGTDIESSLQELIVPKRNNSEAPD